VDDLSFSIRRDSLSAKGETAMAKEKIKKMSGIFASVFAHAGHISKEDAKEISGLDDQAFEEAYSEASSIADKFMDAEGQKMDKFIEHFGAKMEEYMKGYGGKLLK
jgi:hypothetical protein